MKQFIKRLSAAVMTLAMLISVIPLAAADETEDAVGLVTDTVTASVTEEASDTSQVVPRETADTSEAVPDDAAENIPVWAAEAIPDDPITSADTTRSHDTARPDTSAPDAAAVLLDDAVYADGVYTGTGLGYDEGEITVEVTITNGKIANVTSPSHEGQTFWDTFNVDTLLERITAANSTVVDAVSGATESSDGVKDAVNEALRKAAEAASGGGTIPDPGAYVLMNIPYAEFYAAELGTNAPAVDIVTSASPKAYNPGITQGSYHNGATATDILGVTYPVYVPDTSILNAAKYTEITAADIDTAESTLFASPDYTWYRLTDTPSAWKTLDQDGTFTASNAQTQVLSDVDAGMTLLTRRGDYEITLDGDGLTPVENSTVLGVSLTTQKNGVTTQYGLRHLENIWDQIELALFTGHTTTIKNGALTPKASPALEGSTVSRITWYVKSPDGTYQTYALDTDLSIQTYPTATFIDANTVAVNTLSAEDIASALVPADETSDDQKSFRISVYSGSGDDKTYLAEKVYLNADGTVSLTAPAVSGTEYTVEIIRYRVRNGGARVDEDVLIPMSATYRQTGDTGVYALMNIPYAEFYNAVGATNSPDFDAITSATNKTGNYGISGGAYHTEKTAEVADDGTVTAVGGANGATLKGVIWAVKTDSVSALSTLGGKEVTDTDTLTVATVGRGQSSSSTLVSYETLMEAPTYSWYVLDEVPENYLTLTVNGTTPTFSAEVDNAQKNAQIEPSVSYGTNWGDVQLNLSAASDALDKIINAVVFTAQDGTTVGLAHLGNIWLSGGIAWKVATISGLDGKNITNVRYYCSVKDDSVGTDNTDAPAYVNYVYDYPMALEISQVYTGEVTATFDNAQSITVTGLPTNAVNPKAKVYHTTGGRNAVYTYLTPLTVDPADDDIDPVSVDVVNDKISITPGSVTNNAGTTQSYGSPIDGTTYTIELSCDNYIIHKVTAVYQSDGVYALMNIPYAEFYNAVGATNSPDFDAITSATNKTGNYGKSGGAYHTEKTAEVADDGTVTAVGGANGATLKGVIWAVKADSVSALSTLGGKEVTGTDTLTVATVGRGQSSSSVLVGYETLMEAPTYSWYVLSDAPENYLTLTVNGSTPTFSAGVDNAQKNAQIEPSVSYGTNWGDVQLNLSAASDTSDKIINAVLVTAQDGTSVGFAHLGNIWSASEMAWKVATISGLDGKNITNVRYYCSVKDNSVGTDNTEAPTYVNYVYDYPVNLPISQVYTGEVTATFDNAQSITVTGLPTDAVNPKAKVYHTTGGRNAVYTYLTPLTVDPSDDDIDPVSVDITDDKISIAPGSVTNNAGTTQSYGSPIDGTTYTIELSCDNYIIHKVTAVYTSVSAAHTVTFDSNGGSAVNSQSVENGKTVVEPNKPTRNGYTFDKWYLNGTAYDFTLPVTQDITLRAEWTANSSGSGQGCYVATAVYGSYDCPEVWTLRRFRDHVLAKTWYGRLFIHLYYAVSPTAVKLFGDTQWFQDFWRGRLDKMVSSLQADGFASTPYEDQTW